MRVSYEECRAPHADDNELRRYEETVKKIKLILEGFKKYRDFNKTVRLRD